MVAIYTVFFLLNDDIIVFPSQTHPMLRKDPTQLVRRPQLSQRLPPLRRQLRSGRAAGAAGHLAADAPGGAAAGRKGGRSVRWDVARGVGNSSWGIPTWDIPSWIEFSNENQQDHSDSVDSVESIKRVPRPLALSVKTIQDLWFV